MLRAAMAKLVDLPIRARAAVLLLALALCGLALRGILVEHPPLRSVRADLSGLAQEALDQIDSSFGGEGNELLFLVECEPSAPMRARLEALEARLEAHPQVDALLTPRDLPAGPWAAALRAELGAQLGSADGRVEVWPVLLAPGRWISSELIDELDAQAREASRAGELRVAMTGTAPLFLEVDRALDRDKQRFLLLSAGLAFLLGWILFRSLPAVLIAGSGPLVGTLWTYGALGWMGEWLNPLTAAVLPILVMMIGFTDAVHLVMHARGERAAGKSAREAALSAARTLSLPCLLTSLTTAVGFGSLLLADSVAVRRFGFASAIGVSCVFVAVVGLVPALLSTPLGARLGQPREGRFARSLERRGLRWLHCALERSGGLIGLGAGLTLGSFALGALLLRPDDRIAHDLPRESEAYRALASIDAQLGGFQLLNVLVEWDPHTPESVVLEALRQAEEAFEQAPDVSAPFSPRRLHPLLELEQDSLALRWLRGAWNAEERRARATARVRDLGVAHYGPIYAQLERELGQRAEALQGVHLTLTGGPLVYGARVARIVSDLVLSLGVAALILFGALALAFRSLRIGLMSVLPNLFPLAVTAAWMALLGEALEIASVCAFVVCLGIAVDDTIHYLARVRLELRSGCELEAALRRAFLGVGRALATTTAILLVGFGVVLTSELPGNRAFALMACSAIAAALPGDLLLLPAILRRWGRREDFLDGWNTSAGVRSGRSSDAR